MRIGLADAVAAVRDELMEAATRGEGRALAFDVGPVEMEFEIELRAEAKAGGKFRAWVVSGEAEAGVSRGSTHRVSFTLTPRTRDAVPAPGSFSINDRRDHDLGHEAVDDDAED
ncbi:trypco2 family protein [Kitasatospora sp. NBC_01539]|uniref:trypco2 family protein n=1 Tax=Kitasatospora sp. NBC_01539 TaxID=2903577 RepID=UPI00386010B3